MTVRLARFWSQVSFSDDGCWIWVGPTHKGYGKYSGRWAHRVAYELGIGPVPTGLQIDHVCRTPLCVNPEHLEAVTQHENIRRRYETYTHCVNGHEFTPENTRVGYAGAPRSRMCRACQRANTARYKARREAAS